jgi:hypothetical protein
VIRKGGNGRPGLRKGGRLIADGVAPTGTYWNPLDKNGTVVLSGQNLTANGAGRVRANVSASSGKKYYECLINGTVGGSNAPGVGVATSALVLNSGSGVWFPSSLGSSAYPAPTAFCNTGAPVNLNVAFNAGDVWGIAVDITTGQLWFSRNGTFCNGGNPGGGLAHNILLDVGLTLFPATGMSATVSSVTARFKSTSWSFAAPSGFGEW